MGWCYGDEVIVIRVNQNEDVTAIDISHLTALNTLQNVTALDLINVPSYTPVGSNDVHCSVNVYDVYAAFFSSYLWGLLPLANEATIIAKVAPFGASRCENIYLQGSSLYCLWKGGPL